ncbi:uncharacterized protein TNCV_4312241 [Trichonephila clavipes]|nr:uncharacterized protein TNCV_4312241 [Trichonephila clavipes]
MSPKWSPEMMPTWLYRQDFTKFSLNRHYDGSCKGEICLTMTFFERPYVLSLRQMAMTKVAINVCLDPEILDLVKDYGCASFVFPSKVAHLYLNAESPVEETWMWKDFMVEKVLSKFSNLPGRRRSATQPDDWVTRKNILPFARWEELVEERISSFLLPQLLQHELFDVVRTVSIEIDKWIKDHTEDWRKFPEIARCAQYDFQWNSHGKIDRVKTASTLIMNEKLEIEDRYLLAALYGLVDKMPIGEKIPHNIIVKYSNLAENRWSTLDGNVEYSYLKRHAYFLTMSSHQNDEAHFWLNGYVNKQNCRIWSEANPQVYVETPLHPEKLTVWCALWAGGILLQKR